MNTMNTILRPKADRDADAGQVNQAAPVAPGGATRRNTKPLAGQPERTKTNGLARSTTTERESQMKTNSEMKTRTTNAGQAGTKRQTKAQVIEWTPTELGVASTYSVQLHDGRLGLLHVDAPRCLGPGKRRSLVLIIADPRDSDRPIRYSDEDIMMPSALKREIACDRLSRFAHAVQSNTWQQYDASENPELAICAQCDVLKSGYAEAELGDLIEDLSEHGVGLGLVEEDDIEDLKAIQKDFEVLPAEKRRITG